MPSSSLPDTAAPQNKRIRKSPAEDSQSTCCLQIDSSSTEICFISPARTAAQTPAIPSLKDTALKDSDQSEATQPVAAPPKPEQILGTAISEPSQEPSQEQFFLSFSYRSTVTAVALPPAEPLQRLYEAIFRADAAKGRLVCQGLRLSRCLSSEESGLNCGSTVELGEGSCAPQCVVEVVVQRNSAGGAAEGTERSGGDACVCCAEEEEVAALEARLGGAVVLNGQRLPAAARVGAVLESGDVVDVVEGLL